MGIQRNLRLDPFDIEGSIKKPESLKPTVWIMEHMRQFVIDINLLCGALSQHCTKKTCPEMMATEKFTYVCAAHKPNKDCRAIDYISHAIDAFTATLHNDKYFPSRIEVPKESIMPLKSHARRLYRIFAHAYFHHEKVFREVEKERAVCKRFTEFIQR